MTTVKQLIKQLQDNHNPDDAIVFQYMVSDYISQSEKEFAPIAEYLMDNDSFGDESTNFFLSWIEEAESVLREGEEE